MFTKGLQYIESCTADNWEKLVLYPGSSSESIKLMRDGYIIHIYDQHSLGGGSISAWGPDKLELELPDEYDWDVIQANVNLCGMCGKIGPTVRLAFANRVCKECRVENMAEYEYSGWCN